MPKVPQLPPPWRAGVAIGPGVVVGEKVPLKEKPEDREGYTIAAEGEDGQVVVIAQVERHDISGRL